MLWRLAGGILLQERLDPEASPLVLCEDVMLCWSPWTCGLLVRTGVCEDYYRTVRRSGRQVGFILFRMLRDLWFSVSKVTLIRIVLAIFFLVRTFCVNLKVILLIPATVTVCCIDW